MPTDRARGRVVAALLLLLPTACTTLSVRDERKLGERSAVEMNRQLNFVQDQRVVDYVRDLGYRIVDGAGPQEFEYHFYVIHAEQINAFALPAGYIYVHTETILKAKNESELVGVLAHEVGHVSRRHVAKNYRRQQGTGIFANIANVLLISYLPGYAGSGASTITQYAAVAYINKFSRSAEDEADEFAVKVMPNAGYDPNGLVTFFETMRQESAGAPAPLEFLSSHPTTVSRIAHTRALISSAALPPGLSVNGDGRLQEIQARILRLPRAR